MTVAVLITKSAQKEIQNLPALVQVRVQDVILGLVEYPNVVGVKALKGSRKGEYRIRVGAYRIVFVLSTGTVTVTTVDARKDVY